MSSHTTTAQGEPVCRPMHSHAPLCQSPERSDHSQSGFGLLTVHTRMFSADRIPRKIQSPNSILFFPLMKASSYFNETFFSFSILTRIQKYVLCSVETKCFACMVFYFVFLMSYFNTCLSKIEIYKLLRQLESILKQRNENKTSQNTKST